jgi:DNA-binding XRE family transcriptional regulator
MPGGVRFRPAIKERALPGSTDRNRGPDLHSHDIDLDPRLSRLLAGEFPDLIERYEELRALYGVVSKLAALRKEQGLTQAQLAERLGRPQSLVSAIESGRQSPHIETLVAMARELGHNVRIELEPLEG